VGRSRPSHHPRGLRGRLSAAGSGAIGLALTLLSASAAAEDAKSLFDQGLSDMLAGRYAAGCAKIAESYRLEAHAGVLFTLAECHRKEGKIATASERYGAYLAVYDGLPADEQRRQRERAEISRREQTELMPLVPRLTIVLPASAPAGTVVTKDGAALASDKLGTPLPVDPGEHVFTTRAPGGPETRHRTTVRIGEERQVELTVVLADTHNTVVGPPPQAYENPVPPALPPEVPPPDHGSPSPSGSGQRTWAYVVGGVGLAGIVVGAVTGVLVLRERNTIIDSCDTRNRCSDDGIDAADRAQTLGLVSTVGFAVGAAGLTAGTVLWFSAGSQGRSSARGGRATAGGRSSLPGGLIGVSGRF
jgi:hypothetical protein